MKDPSCPKCDVPMEAKEHHPFLSRQLTVAVRFQCPRCGHEALQTRPEDKLMPTWWQRLWGRK
jgi:hypothetical protein